MKSFSFDSSLSKKEVYLTMKELTDPKSERLLFIGDVEEDRFSVAKHYPSYQKFLEPTFNAIVTETNSGTNITVKPSLNKREQRMVTLLFMSACLVYLYIMINATVSGHFVDLLPSAIVILAFEILIPIIVWRMVTFRTRKILKILKNELT